VNISIPHIFAAVLIIVARVSGVMLFAPLFGSAALPARIKAMLVIALTALLYPVVSPRIATALPSQWPLIVATELIIGIGAGIASNIAFDAVQMAGQILSVQMGYSLVNIMDPQSQAESTVVATFHQTIAMLIFLQLNVQFWILQAMARSFDYMPVAGMHFHDSFVPTVLHLGAAIFMVGLQIAAPVLCATLVADIVLGLVGKVSPQLPVMQLGPAVKSLLGIFILTATVRNWPDQFGRLYMRSVAMADHLFHLAS
jgi:flagellar biosynthetic protein FliR